VKGLTHFISGIAAVSFLPRVVERAAAARTMGEGAESSFLLALAGLYAILPDTLDFKLGRFLQPADVDVFPDQDDLDPQAIAEQMGKAMDKAWEENREIRIQFHTLRLSTDRWQQYKIHFDSENQKILITIGDIVTTSQVSFPGTAPENNQGIYTLQSARLLPGSTRDTTVDIMSGPMYGFRKDGQSLAVDFLPWHRTWSHSYTLGLALSLPLWCLGFLAGWKDPWLYALVAFIGFSVHITEDLTGHMGGSLIWPFIRRRTRGLCLFHAANPDANFVTDCIALSVILFNLDRFGPNLITLSAPLYFLIFLVGPLMLYFLPRTMKTRSIEIPMSGKQDERIEIKALRNRLGAEEIEDESDSVIV
jgi:membrane-bound metal-dependent hydrolase YbcI (DUF457 family)